jgi:glutamate synthase (ferredoxin)
MTGGRAVILGPTGRNFAAGMSGGIAYVLDGSRNFENQCNRDMVDLEPLTEPEDLATVRELIEKHVLYTDSAVGKRVLNSWNEIVHTFVKVMPRDYRRALDEARKERKPLTIQLQAA